ncbi:MAG: DUF1080 domain-containing protein, partial [Gemmatimonadaceae bacterium]
MLRYSPLLLALALPAFSPAISNVAPGRREAVDERIIGRWDVTITTPDGPRPSWFEIERSGRDALVGRFVGIVGSARPIARIVSRGDSLRFSVPPQWEEGTADLTVEGRVQGGRLAGRIRFPDGKRYQWTAVR